MFLILLLCMAAVGRQSSGSEVERYLEFLREEQAELDFQLQRGEVTRPFYQRVSQRLRILKELILKHEKNGEGPLPEYHVVPIEELDGLMPDGRNKLKRARPQQVIDGKWRFLKTVLRGETFYILERLKDGDRDQVGSFSGAHKFVSDARPPANSPRLASQEELQSELCSVPNDNRERENAMAKLFLQAGAKKNEIKYQVIDSSLERNVYVVKPGRTRNVIVVGGHIDHVEKGQGVIDNWSGTCAVTNIYQAIRHIKTEHTIVFIGFAKEETGLRGSDAYVSRLSSAARARHKAMINLECLGPAETHVWINGSDEELINKLRTVAEREQIALHEHELEDVSADSDSFREKKILAITLDGLPAEKFSLIHSEKDVCENVNQSFYYDSYRLAVSYLLELDRSPKTATRRNND
jgi:hypothetical protein